MLKNDMRKYLIKEKTYDEFIEDFGEEYRKDFTDDVMKRCWENTKELVDPVEWAKYLKRKAANYVTYLTMVIKAMNEEGIDFRSTRAGSYLNHLIHDQIYKQ